MCDAGQVVGAAVAAVQSAGSGWLDLEENPRVLENALLDVRRRGRRRVVVRGKNSPKS